jgi:hypothetical protein
MLWTLPGELEHPFLTDTVLSLSLEGVTWGHPTTVDKYSHDAEIHRAIHDMFDHEENSLRNHQASRKRPGMDGSDDMDAMATGNNPRKKPRVDEQSSSPASSPSAKQLIRMVSESISSDSLICASLCLVTD